MQKFYCCWKILIFGRNYSILKVFANEKSYEIQKKNFVFMICGGDVLFKHFQDERCAKV